MEAKKGPDQIFGRIDALGSELPYWYLTDRQGSITQVLSQNGRASDTITYDAFGNITNQSLAVPYSAGVLGRYGWTGREIDVETGLQYNRARYYDPTTSRWISQDPMGFVAGDSNLYRYVKNSPTIYCDPSGMVAPTIELLEVRNAISEGAKEAGSFDAFQNQVGWDLGDYKDISSPYTASLGKEFTNQDVVYIPVHYFFADRIKLPGCNGTVLQKVQIKYSYFRDNKLDAPPLYTNFVESFRLKDGVSLIDRHSETINAPSSIKGNPLKWTSLKIEGSLEVGEGTIGGNVPPGDDYKLYHKKEFNNAPDWGNMNVAFTGVTAKATWILVVNHTTWEEDDIGKVPSGPGIGIFNVKI